LHEANICIAHRTAPEDGAFENVFKERRAKSRSEFDKAREARIAAKFDAEVARHAVDKAIAAWKAASQMHEQAIIEEERARGAFATAEWAALAVQMDDADFSLDLE